MHKPALDYDSNACWLKKLLNGIGNLLGQSFLNLKSSCKDISDSSKLQSQSSQPPISVFIAQYLAESQDLSPWYVANMHFAIERNHMMFAQRENLNISNDHHLISVNSENGIIRHLYSAEIQYRSGIRTAQYLALMFGNPL
jgi:hypothetical protein